MPHPQVGKVQSPPGLEPALQRQWQAPCWREDLPPAAPLLSPETTSTTQGYGVCLERVCLLVGCLTSQQHASVSQGRICSDKLTCCHTEIEVADQTFYLTQSQYTDTGPTSPSADPLSPGAWQGNHWSANFEVTGMTRPGKIPSQAGFEPRIFQAKIRSSVDD